MIPRSPGGYTSSNDVAFLVFRFLLMVAAILREEAETGTGGQTSEFGGISAIQINLNNRVKTSRGLVYKLTSCNINVALFKSLVLGTIRLGV